MSPPELERVKSILSQALQLKGEARRRFVKDECGTDSALFSEVQELLSVSGPAEHFLNTPLPEVFGARPLERAQLLPGEILEGRYMIEGLLNEGSFATVYLGRHLNGDNMRIVIKVLEQVHRDDPSFYALKAELQSLARLHHRSVPGLIDSGMLKGDRPFLVRTYIPGITLRDLIKEEPVSLNRARKIVRGIGHAVANAHNSDVFHLDIKPENIIVSEAGTAQESITLIDFGIARLKSLPGRPKFAGSIRYMAPEQKENPTAKCDIFSLGMVAFELFTGHLPERHQRIASQLVGIATANEIHAICGALEEDSDKRIPTVAQFLEKIGPDPLPTSSPRLWNVTTAVSVVVGFFAVLFFARQAGAPFQSKPIPFVTSEGAKYRPAFSPDGDWLFYAAGPLNHLDIYKKGAMGGDPIRVVDHPADDDRPQVSPDGKSLAFRRVFPHESALIVKNLGGGIETEIGRAFEIACFSWASDGKSFAVPGWPLQGESSTIRSIDRETRKWQALVPRDPGVLGDDNPTVSPAGDKMAFVRKWTQGTADLFVVDVDFLLRPKSAPRRITKRLERIDSVQWTPDGREIVYLAGPLDSGSLWRIPANGGDRTAVLPDISRVEGVAIPRNKWTLAYSQQLSDSNVWRLNLESKSEGALQPLISGSYNDEEACLSPDGKSIAFSSGRSGSEQIWLANSDGSASRQITNFSSPDAMSVIWTRDSTDLIISLRSKDLGERIYRSPATGKPALEELMQQASATSLSQDSRYLYICRRIKGQRQLWRADYPKLKKLEHIVSGEARVGRESRDGHFLYFVRDTERDGLWEQELPHGEAKRIVDQIYRRNLFMPGKNGLFYIAGVPGQKVESALFYRNQRDGKTTQLRTFNREVFWGLDISADETKVIFSQFDINTADIMLVEKFH